MHPIGNPFPLTPIQEGMLFHFQLEKHSVIDIEQIVCELNEEINVTALEKAWDKVIIHHAVCRTGFSWEGLDKPMQQVYENISVPILVCDWSKLPAEKQDTKFSDYLEEDRKKGFELDSPPLLRLTLFKFNNACYKFVWSFHHILLDGRSMPLVLKDVFHTYDLIQAGKQGEPHSPPTFSNHVKALNARDSSRDESFWKTNLKGYEGIDFHLFETSQEQKDSPIKSYKHETASLTAEQSQHLQDFVKNNDISMNTLVQAGWALLLHHYTGSDDIVFGVTRACRNSNSSEFKDTVGMFINTLPTRVKIDSSMNVATWLQNMSEQVHELKEFEQSSLVDIRKWSQISNSTPLFESTIVFDYQTLDTATKNSEKTWSQRHFKLLEQTNFPITLYAYAEKKLQLKIAYDSQQISHEMSRQMIGHLSTLLLKLTHDSSAKLNLVSPFTEAELQKVLVDWNATEATYEHKKCLHQLFEEQVKKTPQKTAVICKDNELSYSELNKRANQLAHYLRRNKVAPDMLIGICIDRSVEMMVGLLGILKAGAAYVPLDPSYPKARIEMMLDDAKCQFVITRKELTDSLPNVNAEYICLDQDWSQISVEPDNNPTTNVKSSNLCYVIYTSGSTGKPKGVMVEHRNVVNFFTGMDELIETDDESTWLAVTSLSFDISVLELFWTLTRGVKTVIYSDPNGGSSFTIAPQTQSNKKIDFSLFYFASDEGESTENKYKLLLEGAKFADNNGFSSVWTPERHFHAFGGLYPNPSVVSAAIAATTTNVKIRAGSVVVPLHNPIRITEEWSLVDNLSNGRVGISIAPGWQPNDFVLAPDNFAKAKDVMSDNIQTIQKLWRGEEVAFAGPKGNDVQVKTLPRPIQKELPIWVTAAGNPATFENAGRMGANMLTHLLGQSLIPSFLIFIYGQLWCQEF